MANNNEQQGKKQRGRPKKEDIQAKKEALNEKIEEVTKAEQTRAKSDIDVNELDAELTRQNMGQDAPEEPKINTQNNSGTVDNTVTNEEANTIDMPAEEVDPMPTDINEPLSEPVIKRDYTNTGPQTTTPNPANPADPAATTPPPPVEEIIPEVTVDPTIVGPSGEQSKYHTGAQYENPTPKGPEQNHNPKLDDLSPSQKRKAAEKAADALIASYANIVPKGFIWVASFNVPKLQRMELKGDIKLKMIVQDDGLRVIDYINSVNSQAKQVFTITEEMKLEIKDPLVDVLLENNMAMTPTQRLMLAIGQQLFTMGITAVQFLASNRQAIAAFKDLTAQAKAKEKADKSKGGPNGPAAQPVNNNPTDPPPTTPSAETQKEADTITLDDVLDETSGKMTIEYTNED